MAITNATIFNYVVCNNNNVFSYKESKRMESPNDGIFVGFSVDAFLGVGGFFKIGFNIGGN